MGFFSELFNQQEEVVAPPRRDAQAIAGDMSREEVNGIISEYGTGTHPFIFMDAQVRGEVKDLVVQWVSVYGIRYESIPEALAARPRLQNEDLILEMQQVHADFDHARRAMHKLQVPYKKISTLFDGDVFFYNEGEFGLSRDMAANLVNTQSGMMVKEVYLGHGEARYSFDFTQPAQLESFKLLVGSNAAHKGAMDELMLLMARLSHHSQLHQEGRLRIVDGQVFIAPPTAAQIKGGQQ